MSNLKPMSGADYRAHAQAKREEQPTEIVSLSSGSVFELRRLDLESHVLMGSVPQSLLNEGLAAWKKNGIIKAGKKAEDDEFSTDSLIFAREVVHEVTVKPKFVEFATNENEIGARDMLKQDFKEIFHWAMTHLGVTGLDGLRSFRTGQSWRTTGAGADRKKQRSKSKQSSEPVETVQ